MTLPPIRSGSPPTGLAWPRCPARRRGVLAGVLTAALLHPLPVQGQSGGQSSPPPAADSLRLPALMEEAVARNPGLQAMRAVADAAGHRVQEAGTLPDPLLQVGAMNLGLPELDAGMPASMLPSVQLTQSFPFFGKLGLREEIAGTREEAARVSVEEAEWRLRADVGAEFHALYALDRSLEVHRRTLDLLQDFQSVARSLYAAGTGRQGDVVRADVEVARMDAEIQRMTAVRAARTATLNALLDRPGGTPVPTPAVPPLPGRIPGVDTLMTWALASRPALARERVELEAARKGVELASRDFWPDFTVSAQYGHRGGENPRSMGSLMIGASLPIHAGSRQQPRREAARALQREAESRVNGVQASVEAQIRTALADLERARSLMTLYRDEILPAARVNVSSSLASYRVGGVDFPTLVDAQLAVDRFEVEYHQLVADHGTALARLEAAMGRTIPHVETP